MGGPQRYPIRLGSQGTLFRPVGPPQRDGMDNKILDLLTIEGRGSCFVYKARFSYNPRMESPNKIPEEELQFNSGDIVLVWGNMDDDGFYRGELLNGKTGWVPSTFVRQIVGDELVEFLRSYVQGSLMTQPTDQFGCVIDDDFYMDDINAPPPIGLVVERRFHKSLLIGWKPPKVDPDGVHYYKVFLNGIHRCTTQVNDETRTLLEGIQEDKVYRVSVRSMYKQQRLSRDAACSMLVGLNPPVAPLAIRILKITSTSAIVCWFPSRSEYRHGILVNNVKVSSSEPGIFHDVIAGLSSNTSYRVTVYTEDVEMVTTTVAASLQEKLESVSTHTVFRTLVKDLKPPQNVQVESGPLENKILVSWIPVIDEPTYESISPDVVDVGAKAVTGYAVFANGKKIWEINSPLGDHALLDLNNPYFQSKPPEIITVRTKYGDLLSTDSNPCSPINLLNMTAKSQKVGLSSSNIQTGRRTDMYESTVPFY